MADFVTNIGVSITTVVHYVYLSKRLATMSALLPDICKYTIRFFLTFWAGLVLPLSVSWARFLSAFINKIFDKVWLVASWLLYLPLITVRVIHFV